MKQGTVYANFNPKSVPITERTHADRLEELEKAVAELREVVSRLQNNMMNVVGVKL